jgi:hypothetical protein
MRQQGVVRADTSVQFQKHVVAQYTVGRLFSGTLPLRFYPVSYGVVRLRRMTFQSCARPASWEEIRTLRGRFGLFERLDLMPHRPTDSTHVLPQSEHIDTEMVVSSLSMR